MIAVGGFDENFKRQEDVELGFRLSQNGLGFRFESRADGYHRPIRTYDSWLKTPYLYGVRDVQMARDKGEKSSIELAQKHYTERNLVTRICARVFVGRPILEPLLFIILRPAPIALDKIGLRRVGIGVLSLLFNLLYLQGMAKEIGGAGKMWRLLSVGASA